ncbi:hypothetical protein B0H14DRAFT_2635298 [Mycena olivaceomarginata]|nr:hypothetical protein B0H14DRAFT_2635298 [Mycena olivaceomarginata]
MGGCNRSKASFDRRHRDSAALSLLSLSIAASNAQPIPLNEQAKHPGALSHHRRLSSTGRRRRLSDARDAASRPLSVGSPGLSMAALTLSTSASPPSSAVAHAMPASPPAKSSTPIPIAQPAAATAGARKKRGVDHKCEACSKIYRHPLVPDQAPVGAHAALAHAVNQACRTRGQAGARCGDGGVDMYAHPAAILSHLSPDSETGTSLPEDRGMWPRWVSGGALEGEDDVPGSVPASVSSAYGYPSSVGGGGYSGGGGSEYGTAGWRGMRQCTIAYTSDPPCPVARRRGYAACPPPSASPPTLPVAHTSSPYAPRSPPGASRDGSGRAAANARRSRKARLGGPPPPLLTKHAAACTRRELRPKIPRALVWLNLQRRVNKTNEKERARVLTESRRRSGTRNLKPLCGLNASAGSDKFRELISSGTTRRSTATHDCGLKTKKKTN